MQPFKIEVSWYGDVAEVNLLVLGTDWIEEDPRLLRTFPDAVEAVGWAVKWFKDRGLTYCHLASWHEAQGHKHVVLHAVGRS